MGQEEDIRFIEGSTARRMIDSCNLADILDVRQMPVRLQKGLGRELHYRDPNDAIKNADNLFLDARAKAREEISQLIRDAPYSGDVACVLIEELLAEKSAIHCGYTKWKMHSRGISQYPLFDSVVNLEWQATVVKDYEGLSLGS